MSWLPTLPTIDYGAATLIAGIMTFLGTIVSSLFSLWTVHRAGVLHVMINSRMSELLDSKEIEAVARAKAAGSIGEALGKAKEKAGQAREEIGRVKEVGRAAAVEHAAAAAAEPAPTLIP